MAKKEWSKADALTLIGLPVAVVACIAGVLAIPGMPRFLHLDSDAGAKQPSGLAPVDTQKAATPTTKSVQRVRDVSSGQVNFGCDQTVSVETPVVFFGRNPRDVIAQPEWAGLDNVKGHNQSVANTEDPSDHHLKSVKGVGSITGLDSQSVLGIKNCPGGGHGELKLHVSWTEDVVAAAASSPCTPQTHVRIIAKIRGEGSKSATIKVELTRSGCLAEVNPPDRPKDAIPVSLIKWFNVDDRPTAIQIQTMIRGVGLDLALEDATEWALGRNIQRGLIEIYLSDSAR